jgi:hypothetical protein
MRLMRTMQSNIRSLTTDLILNTMPRVAIVAKIYNLFRLSGLTG